MPTIDILWTGGWDSTFRVLDAASMGVTVRPHYIVHTERRSHAIEFLTIGLVMNNIRDRYPDARIDLPRLTLFEDIPADPDISHAFQRLAAQSHLGSQYDWLARYVNSLRIDGLELCIHRDDKAHKFVAPHARSTKDDPTCYRVPKTEDDVSTIFSRFRYPILDLTKLEMEEIAQQRGFIDILQKSWFCFSPTRSGEPCGVCNPCIFTIEEGMTHRLSIGAIRRYERRNHPATRLLQRAKQYSRRAKGLALRLTPQISQPRS